MITLREITKDNFWDCVELAVAPGQEEYVTSNAVSLAQSKYQTECIPLAIYSGDLMVGFLMYCIDTDDNEWWIYRIMIDAKYQSRGYAREALRLLIEKIKKDPTRHKILLGTHKVNAAAEKLYTSFGFYYTGQVFGDEAIMQLDY